MKFENRNFQSQIINAYGQWLLDEINSEDHSYFVTFLFRPCHGSVKNRLEIMQAGINAFYRKLACACVRYPSSKMGRHLLPLLVAFPDWPVPKTEKKSVAEMSINDGLHLHALGVIRQQSRMRVPLHVHLREYKRIYVNDESPLFRVHAEPVTDPARTLTDYLFKQAERGRFSSDDVLVLPKAWSELHSSRSKA